jgi:hypothetical protein
VLIEASGKLLSSKLGAFSRRVLSITSLSPRIICFTVSNGTAASLVEPRRPCETMTWVILPCSSMTTSFTSPIVSPVEVSTFLPISLETRCLSAFLEASRALAVRIESEDMLSSSLEVAGGVAEPLDVVELEDVVSEPEIGGVPVVLGSWLGSWLGLEL